MNTLVSFEIAKLLKEKGFNNIECNGYYHICYSDVNSQHETDILAPTIADVVMWLYDEYGIWIDVSTIKWNFDDNTIRFAYHITVYIDKSPSDNINSRFDYSSPTEAYGAAIEYTLNNLI